MKWLKRNGVTIVLVTALLIGAGLILYPTVSDWYNSFHQSRAVAGYAETVANLNQEEFDKLLKEAEAYNKKLARTGMLLNMDEAQEKEYFRQLAIEKEGVIAYIDIPKINIVLPIYHGVDERVLSSAIGHIPGSSLPVGGKSSHCVVSGHRGLPSARLFTDIDKLVEGDQFTVNVLNQTLTYEVDQIRVVEPSDFSDLKIIKGKDYMTLVTCTPYGINTHRLLVRGHRTANANGEAVVIADALQIEPIYIAPFIAVPIILLLVIGLFINTSLENRAKRMDQKRLEQLKREYRTGEPRPEEEEKGRNRTGRTRKRGRRTGEGV